MTIYAHLPKTTPYAKTPTFNWEPKIILNMIVRNEESVIRRCLESVKPHIDEWCIVDTGSTDNTKEIIQEVMAGVPGSLHESVWVNFEHNRNEALRFVKNTNAYLLFVDADEMLKVSSDFKWPKLTADAYYLPVEYSGTSYARVAVVSNQLEWSWKGAVHEFLESKTPAKFDTLKEPTIVVYHEGARSRDPKTYEKDALLLEAENERNPNDPRTVFYLAQSWKDAGHFLKAKHFYLQRSIMEGWNEETWYALYQVGIMCEKLGLPTERIQAAYLAAYQNRPTRAEPLYQLARYHRERREFALATMFAREGMTIPYPQDRLFIDKEVYDWKLQDEFGTAAYYVQNRTEGKRVLMELAMSEVLPEHHRERILMNLGFYK